MNMQSPAVRHEQMRIAGSLVDTDEHVEVFNPYTNKVVGTVPAARPEHVRSAFARAAAFKPKLTRYERQRILLRTAEILAGRKEEFARLITAESGLCWKDSLYEAGRAYDVYSFAGQLAIKDDGETFSCDISPQGKARKIFTTRTPLLGAISAITPFNHPLNMVSHKIAPAIATNNRVVLKPTELTPLTALALADVLYEAGLPPEMLSVVTGNPHSMGDAMLTDPDADLVTFTGSVRVGKHIASKAGYKRLVLELGGNDPLIVMEDADLEKAAELAVTGATKNSGQRCTAVKRILCVEAVADDFSALVLKKARKLKCGDPMDPTVDVGTVIHEGAAKEFERRVNAAVADGAELLHGNDRDGALYPPTVVDRIPYTSELVMQETFGPVIPIIRVPNDIDSVIRISNATAFGLSSGVCTNRLDYITRFVNELDVGTVNVWEVPGYRIEMSPFGGIKDSGLGYKEGVQEAIKSFTNVKTYSLPWPA
ncbi:putative phosphonoacetaldehyde dehydrogenase [Bradyrhizobium japonicum]|jgi:phosphonoacetaldehyde dehydrogenase|uniref:phosphonoacetaldehyde dehydrogenase n=1 Tax=Bradyrhizobium TaxID=374 RepID=UPI00035E90C9|nr:MULTISPECIES: phosphonoacetaldehyde dehydrogenase [Bradyrhizobium]MCP1731715.1 putative phosphonoacetaldehyde dehydrogenase [Bradyrhizobium elkanii]MCP1932433.1 putative phosphonoacetaldehyde dehydrogenase [Bradyrhizobium elkanii]MCP1969248.1 putative phosphonoacetaldehyde dehydrogenase [Bradyrhizobium elkanii]MCS3479640.1 putative phosphonoacetaldehyde dehydrogenase [Bradyrhizobium elkanii]MCS3516445.1 putative phosphonoacetaldehyde dehydrogenase [Bradyrhizobium elkanii]